MDNKSKIVKSKSNSITNSEIRPLHKTCKKNKVQEQVAKKRGVYVERFSNTVIDNERPKKSPVRVRPSEKKFLDSVLTILSKSSNGTQFPEGNSKNSNNIKLNKKSNRKNKPRIADITNINDIKKETLTILPPNDVMNTPLKQSPRIKTKLDLFIVHSTDTITDMNTPCDMESLRKDLSAGNINNESMSETADFDIYNKKIYNISTDMLEPTVSVHGSDNVEQSPTGLQMNEPVHQLNNNKKERKNIRYSTESMTNTWKAIYIDNDAKLKKSKPIEKTARYTKPPTKPLFLMPEKIEMRKRSRKRDKRNFINYLKQQLQMDNSFFDEPHSFFETLKLIVRNKKNAAISIDFRKAEQAYIDSKECMHQNRKVTLKNKNKKSNIQSLRQIPSTYLDFSS